MVAGKASGTHGSLISDSELIAFIQSETPSFLGGRLSPIGAGTLPLPARREVPTVLLRSRCCHWWQGGADPDANEETAVRWSSLVP